MNPFKKIKKAIINKRKDKQFVLREFEGYQVIIPTDKIDNLYSKKIMQDISRNGPLDVRDSFPEVQQWCKQSQGVVRGDFAVGIDYQPMFEFSRREVAQEFKKKFLSE